jgi:hypothetical protein
MIKVKNTSTQSFEIYFMTEAGSKTYWITPGKSIAVPETYITDQVRLMQRRRILNLTSVG